MIIFYAFTNLLGVALSDNRVAICNHAFPVSSPISTLKRVTATGVPVNPQPGTQWTTRTEYGIELEREPWCYQPSDRIIVGDVALLVLHPGYPIPKEDIVEIAPIADGETRMLWFKRTKQIWVEGTFYDAAGVDIDGQPPCNGSTTVPVEDQDSGSVVISNGRIVGFVARARNEGRSMGIARLLEGHRDFGMPRPADVVVPPVVPVQQPPAEPPPPTVPGPVPPVQFPPPTAPQVVGVCLSFIVEEIVERYAGDGVVVHDTTLRNFQGVETLSIRGRIWPVGSKVDFREIGALPTIA